MKKLILSLLVVMGTLTVGKAEKVDFLIPADRDGYSTPFLEQVGVFVYMASASVSGTVSSYLITGSSAMVFNSTSNSLYVSTLAIYGVMLSTKPTGSEAATAFMNLRSTTVANTSSELLVPPIEFSSTTRNTFVWFQPPIICPGNLSVDISSTAASGAVFYRFLSTPTENYWVPVDYAGRKTPSSDWHGVKAGTNVVMGASDGGSVSMTDYNTSSLPLSTAPALLYGTFAGTTTLQANTYVLIYDSANVTGLNSANYLIPPLFYNMGDSSQPDYTHSGDRNKQFKFPFPLIAKNGIIVKNSVGTNRLRYFIKPRSSLR